MKKIELTGEFTGKRGFFLGTAGLAFFAALGSFLCHDTQHLLMRSLQSNSLSWKRSVMTA